MANIIDYRLKIGHNGGIYNARYYLCNGQKYLDVGHGKDRIISKVLNIRPHEAMSVYVMLDANHGKEYIIPSSIKIYRVRPDDLTEIITNKRTVPFNYNKFGW